MILPGISPQIVPNPTGGVGIVELRALGWNRHVHILAVFIFNKKEGKSSFKTMKAVGNLPLNLISGLFRLKKWFRVMWQNFSNEAISLWLLKALAEI